MKEKSDDTLWREKFDHEKYLHLIVYYKNDQTIQRFSKDKLLSKLKNELKLDKIKEVGGVKVYIEYS